MNTTMPIKWLPFPASVTSQCDVTELIGNDEFWLGDTWAKQRYLPWQFFYVDYDVLKKCGADGMVLKLQDEWIKVYNFYILKRGEIERRIDYYKILMVKQVNPVPQNTLKFMLVEIHHLYHFVKLNYCALLRLYLQHQVSTDMLERTWTKRPLWDHFLPLLHLSFKINQLVINHDNALYCCFLPPDISHVVSKAANPKYSCQKKTYCVHPDNLMEVILFLCTKASIISNRQTVYKEARHEIGTPLSKPKAEDMDSTRVQTLYLDSPRLTTYKQLCCAARDDDAVPAVYARWSGDNNHAMVERKYASYLNRTRREEWIQERIWLKTKHIQPWLNADYSISHLFSKETCEFKSNGSAVLDQIEDIKEACLSLETEIHSQEKIPVLKVEQNRLCFILNNSNVTISLDYDIVMDCLITQERKALPYCIFQMSFDSDEESAANEWVQFFSRYDILQPLSDDFSLYLYGVGTLSKQEVLPDWLPSFRKDDLRCYSSRGQLIEDEPSKDIYTRSTPLINRKSIDSITTATEASDFSVPSNDTTATSHDEIFIHEEERTKKKAPKRHGSYCSFDHPTSSNSDPTNCKSCLAKLIIVPDKKPSLDRQNSPIFRRTRPNDEEITTFGAFLLKTFLPRRFRSSEKEPLMSPTYRQYRTFSSQHLDEELGRMAKNERTLTDAWSRAAVFTSITIVLSSSLLYIFYFLISADIF